MGFKRYFIFTAKALNAEFTTLDKLLNQSDFVVLSVPLSDETHHMINSTTLALMKSNAILINVGRGGKFDNLLINLVIMLLCGYLT